MAKKDKEEKVVIEKTNKREEINLKEFMLLDSKKQDAKIKETIDLMYEGKVEVTKKHIDKVLNIAFDTRDNETYLPASLRVEKIGSKLIFSFKKTNNLALFILFALAFLFVGGFATYMGVQYLARLELNQDLDGDGVADLNIDLDDDGICDINCDTDKDGLPDRNIDYRSNRKPIFNILLEDGSIFNPINQDTNGDGVCDINCDTNSDGWPDLNIDIDGDGIVDFDRDIDGDGIKDLDLDLDGDGICDINCDTDKDNVCDTNCTNANINGNGGGTSQEGNGGMDFTTANLIVVFDSTDDVVAENIYPDDQTGQGLNTTIPSIGFTVQNTTNQTLYYNLSWTVNENTFTSDNFWYRVTSDNAGFTQDWTTAPTSDYTFATRVAVAPNTTQTYSVDFTLHGTGEPQNYDQGKIFNGQIHVDLIGE
mgnify:CR=1 FL=1